MSWGVKKHRSIILNLITCKRAEADWKARIERKIRLKIRDRNVQEKRGRREKLDVRKTNREGEKEELKAGPLKSLT